jgi:hypothetical protein
MAKAFVGTVSLEQTGCDLPGVVGDGMSRRTGSESVEPLGGRLGIVCTAKASSISRTAVKSGCASEWGGWGRLSVDGPEQKNPDRSEGPWGRAAEAARTEVFQRTTSSGTERGSDEGSREHGIDPFPKQPQSGPDECNDGCGPRLQVVSPSGLSKGKTILSRTSMTCGR